MATNLISSRRPVALRARLALLGAFLCALALSACGSVSTLTPIESALSSNEEPPFGHIPEHWVLFRAEGFYGSVVGVRGDPSREVIAFRMLFARPEADAAFKDLIRRASLPGQLYGLCGVYFTDPPAFRSEVVRYLAMEDEIEEQRYGCIVEMLPVSQVARSLDLKAVRLDGPEDSIESWRHRQRLTEEEEGILDIIGGGFPIDFKTTGATDPEAIAEGQRLVPSLLALLEHDDPGQRAQAAESLSLLGPLVLGEAVDRTALALGKLLSDPESNVRTSARDALLWLGAWSVKALPAIERAVAGFQEIDPESPEGKALLYLVWLMGKVGPPARDHLVRLLIHPAADIRGEVLLALHELGPLALRAAPEILKNLRDADPDVRAAAARTLGGLGPSAKGILPSLRIAREDHSLEVRYHAMLALWKLGRESEGAIAIFSEAPDGLEDGPSAFWKTLGEMGRENADRRRELTDIARKGPNFARLNSIRILGGLGPAAAGEVIPVLRELLDESERDIAFGAVGAFLNLGEGPSEVLPVLIRALASPDSESIYEAANLLERIGPAAAAAVPALIENLRHEELPVRASGLNALGSMGPAARAAVPSIARALEDESFEPRDVARDAIEKIGS